MIVNACTCVRAGLCAHTRARACIHAQADYRLRITCIHTCTDIRTHRPERAHAPDHPRPQARGAHPCQTSVGGIVQNGLSAVTDSSQSRQITFEGPDKGHCLPQARGMVFDGSPCHIVRHLKHPPKHHTPYGGISRNHQWSVHLNPRCEQR